MRGCYAGYLLQGKSDGALGRSRTDNLLIRSQMLYPLSYERLTSAKSTCRRDNGYTRFFTSKDPSRCCVDTYGKQQQHLNVGQAIDWLR